LTITTIPDSGYTPDWIFVEIIYAIYNADNTVSQGNYFMFGVKTVYYLIGDGLPTGATPVRMFIEARFHNPTYT
jgi:hypothetical protein